MFGFKLASLFIDIVVRADKAANTTNAVHKSLMRLANLAVGLYLLEKAFGSVEKAVSALLRTAGDIEANFGTIKRITGMTSEELSNFKDQVFGISEALKGINLDDFQKTISAAAQLGFKDRELLQFSETAAKLAAVSTDLSFDESARSLGVFLNVFGEGSERAEELAGALLRVSNESNATSGQIINISERLAGYAATVGLSAEQTFAFSAAMKDAGVKNEVAASSLIALLRTLTTEPQKVAKALGLTGDALTKFTSDVDVQPVEALLTFFRELRNMPPAKVSSLLDELGVGDVRQLPTLQSLARTYDSLTRNLEIVGDAQANQTKLAQDAADKAGELNSKIVDLSESWERLKNSLVNLEVFKEVIDTLGGMLDQMRILVDYTNSDDWRNLFAKGPNAFGQMVWDANVEKIQAERQAKPEPDKNPGQTQAEKDAEKARRAKESQDFRRDLQEKEAAKANLKLAEEAKKVADERYKLELGVAQLLAGQAFGGILSQLSEAQTLINGLREQGMLDDNLLSMIRGSLDLSSKQKQLEFQDPTQAWIKAQQTVKPNPEQKKVMDAVLKIAEKLLPDMTEAIKEIRADDNIVVGP